VDHLSQVSDGELVKRAQIKPLGDASGAEAIGELYDRYNEQVFRYVWARVYDRNSAEDLTGEVFVRMVANLPKYRPTSTPFLAWLYRIAHNLVIDHYRKEENKRELHLDQVDQLLLDTNNPADMTEDKMFYNRIKIALLEINPTWQEVIVLRFLMGMSLQEVAVTLGKSVGAVKVAQHRGLKELRNVLQPEVSED
jgi:RNA polymerase sigma-70 factor (ECF subfamily)